MASKTFVFTDESGGSLAALAATIATARGVPARAETPDPRPLRSEVVEALTEIGLGAPAPVERPKPPGPRETIIRLGPSGDVEVALYEGPDATAFGPTDLERRTLARISRDRIERWLELTDHSGSQS